MQMLNKYIALLKQNAQKVIIAILLIALGYIAFSNNTHPPSTTVELEQCEDKVQTQYVLRTDDFLASKDVVIYDLSQFKLLKTKKRGDKVGYYYSQEGKYETYVTIFKPKGE
jgi:hypothetical protein